MCSSRSKRLLIEVVNRSWIINVYNYILFKKLVACSSSCVISAASGSVHQHVHHFEWWESAPASAGPCSESAVWFKTWGAADGIYCAQWTYSLQVYSSRGWTFGKQYNLLVIFVSSILCSPQTSGTVETVRKEYYI